MAAKTDFRIESKDGKDYHLIVKAAQIIIV